MNRKNVEKLKCKEYIPSFLNGKSNSETYTDTNNGLFFVNIYVPEEILLNILSHIDPKEVLNYCLVCHKWNKLIKSYSLWSMIYERKYNRLPKKLPWYLYYCLLSTNYFNSNLLLNGNGQDGLNNWVCKAWEGDNYIEDPPIGVEPLPLDIKDFNNKTSCFATSYFMGRKTQWIKLGKSKLFRYIMDNYKPHIYISEWIAGRFDCGCIYKMHCQFIGKNLKNYDRPFVSHRKVQWEAPKWQKMELLVVEYPEGIEAISFENEVHNTQTWKGHFGCKMAGGTVKLLFDSIEPLSVDEYGNVKTTRFSKIKFTANGLPQEKIIDYYAEWNMWNGEDYEEIYYFMP